MKGAPQGGRYQQKGLRWKYRKAETWNGRESRQDEMLSTYEANRIAVGGCTVRLVAALKRLGMRRCSARLVRYQFEEGSLRPSYYYLFWRWFEALWLARREGAEFLWEDLRARVEALRAAQSPPHTRTWYEQLACVEREHSEAIQAAILRADERTIRSEVADQIRELRALIAMLDRKPRSARAKAA